MIAWFIDWFIERTNLRVDKFGLELAQKLELETKHSKGFTYEKEQYKNKAGYTA